MMRRVWFEMHTSQKGDESAGLRGEAVGEGQSGGAGERSDGGV